MPPEVARTDLAWYVDALEGGEGESTFLADSQATATALVENFIGTGNPFQVPEEVTARVILEVGADLYFRRQARNGIQAFEGMDITPYRIARDPMAAGYPMLRQFIPTGIA